MPNDLNILQRVNRLEAMGLAMQQEAAMLRKDLSAGGQPAGPRKGKINEDIALLARARYQRKIYSRTK